MTAPIQVPTIKSQAYTPNSEEEYIALVNSLHESEDDIMFMKETLIYSCSVGYINLARIIIEKNIDPNFISLEQKSTPLGIAILHEKPEIVQYLLSLEITNPNMKFSEFEFSALHLATLKYNERIFELLISRNDIELDPTDKALNTPLHIALKHPKTNIPNFTAAKKLLEKGAFAKITNNKNITPLHLAILAKSQANPDSVDESKEILEKILSQFGKDSIESSVIPYLHFTAMLGQTDIFELLIDKGPSLNIRDAFGNTPLHIASKYGGIDILYKSIEFGKDEEPEDADETSDDSDAICYLNLQNKDGNTALHIAIMNKRTDIAKILIEKEARLVDQNKDGKTPVDLAIDHQNKELLSLMFDYQAYLTEKQYHEVTLNFEDQDFLEIAEENTLHPHTTNAADLPDQEILGDIISMI